MSFSARTGNKTGNTRTYWYKPEIEKLSTELQSTNKLKQSQLPDGVARLQQMFSTISSPVATPRSSSSVAVECAPFGFFITGVLGDPGRSKGETGLANSCLASHLSGTLGGDRGPPQGATFIC